MNIELTIIFLGLLVFSAHLFASIYRRRKIPDVLLLMFIGLLAGPVFGVVSIDSFGIGGPLFVAITLVVILFEGGTSLSLAVMKSAWRSTMSITVTCFIASVFLIGVVGFLFGLSPIESLTLGTILGGTSSAVVIPLVRTLQMGDQSKTLLILESATTDVLCIVFTLAFLQAISMGTIKVGFVVGDIVSSFLLAGVFGFAGALVWSRLITKMRKLQNSIFTTPAFVFIIYGLADYLGYSGAIAALVFGVTMANIETFTSPLILKIMGGRPHKLNKTEMVFFGELVFLLKTVFFVYIGISIEFSDIKSVIAGLIITALLFVTRLVLTKYFAPKQATIFDKTIVSMMIPKGLAAAVLAGMPLAMGIEGGMLIKNITYSVILFSILLVAIMILLVEKSTRVRLFYELLYGDNTNKPKEAKKRGGFGNIYIKRIPNKDGEDDDDIVFERSVYSALQDGKRLFDNHYNEEQKNKTEAEELEKEAAQDEVMPKKTLFARVFSRKNVKAKTTAELLIAVSPEPLTEATEEPSLEPRKNQKSDKDEYLLPVVTNTTDENISKKAEELMQEQTISQILNEDK